MKIKPFTEEELNRFFLEWEKEMKEKEESLSLFLKSSRFTDIIEKIKTRLKTEKSISDDVYSEFIFDDVKNEEFIKLFEVLFNPNLINLKINEDSENPFYTQYIMYQGLKFSEIHGQGTAFFVEMAEGRGLDPQT